MKTSLLSMLILSVLTCLWSCRKDSLVRTVSNEVNMTKYLSNNPEQFSELSKILKLSGTASFLNAFGSYTLFAPTNDAIKAYLLEQGKTSVEDISSDDWKSFVRFHLLEDSIPTSKFSDGKLPQLTMYGQYLTTTSVNENAVTRIKVNRQANVIKADIPVGNGLIHSIDHILTPASLSLAQTIEANPEYSIFTKALIESGLYASLNILPANNPVAANKWLTVIAQTDDVFKAANILSYEDLLDKYSDTGNPKLPQDSLHLFLKYHILYDAKYLADIITSDAHNTLAPLEVLTSKLSGETVLINDDTFNGIYEPGFSLLRNRSDITATNGVLHDASQHFAIKLRSPFRVDFDVAAFPEMVKNTAYYKSASYEFSPDEAAALTEIKFSTKEGQKQSGLIYRHGSAGTSKNSHNKDILVVPLAAGGTSSRAEWVDFRTPLLIRGKYKVWVTFYTQKQSSNSISEAVALIGIDGSEERVPLSNARTLSFISKRPGIEKTVNGVKVTDYDALEAIGWKTYMKDESGSQVGRLMGVADLSQTGRYWLRLKSINGSQTTNNIDMIHFIPIGDDQQYWKYEVDGTKIFRP